MKIWRWLFVLLLLVPVSAQTRLKTKTKNVVVITLDGVRWEDIFRGPDESLMTREIGGVREALLPKLKADYLRASQEQARRDWLPFFWGTIAKQGQIYGNQDKSSVAQITNTFRFSYPGYNEILTGKFDPRINTNDFGPNPNVTVFEWLNQMPEFKGKVSAFGAWFAFPNIFNRERSGIYARGQWEPPLEHPQTPEEKRLDELFKTTVKQWSDEIPDSFLQLAVKDHVKRYKPRLLFIGYGETDKWSHLGRIDQYLRSAKLIDQFIADLWAMMQAMPHYRGSTTFIITTDHGRGPLADWRNHGEKVEGAQYIWMAVMGPDTPALGERTNVEKVTQSQVAATVAALLGKDYNAAVPEAGRPLAEALPKKP